VGVILPGYSPATNRKCAVTKIVEKTATLQSLQTCQLTKEQVYRLLKCAIKDDDRLVDALIQKIYDTMIAFDPKRAEIVIGLIVDRHEAAEPTFHDFLRDIKVSADNLPFPWQRRIDA
jgi:hypothetical protein